MSNLIKYLLAVSLLLLSLPGLAQFFKKQGNRVDEQGKRKGVWKSYWDEEDKVPMSMARYKDGREVGVSKEYHINGKLRLKFRHQNGKIRVKYYDEDRRLEQKGWSVIEYNEEETRYYWHGKWKFYDENRKLVRIACYEQGAEVEDPTAQYPDVPLE